MSILDLPIPPKPSYFGPDGAPPGVTLQLDAYDVLNDGFRWKDSRPQIRPRVHVVHTNAAPVEGSTQSQLNWGRSGRNTTKPHYCVNGPTPIKTLPSNLRGIANSTGASIEQQYGVWDSSYWSLAIETADLGSIEAKKRGINWPYDCGPFITNSRHGLTPVPHAEIVARILAYESMVWSTPLTVPEEFGPNMEGVVCHTSPFPYPYFTIANGKTCPGTTKINHVFGDILTRAQQIRDAWSGVTPPPPTAGDIVSRIIPTSYRYDTRQLGGKLQAGKNRAFTLPNSLKTADTVGMAITVVGAPGNAHLCVWSGEGSRPLKSNVNFSNADTSPSNGYSVVSVGDDKTFSVYSTQPCHVILDIEYIVIDEPAGTALRG